MLIMLIYIEPNLRKIEQGSFLEVPLSSLPGWEPMLGFQLENLLLKNRSLPCTGVLEKM